MKPLELSFRCFTLLCICETNETRTNPLIRLRNILYVIVALFFVNAANCAGIVFIIKNFSTDLAGSLCALFQAGALCEGVYTYIVGFILRKEIQQSFADLRNIYEKSKAIKY